jgi:hypothetical protein
VTRPAKGALALLAAALFGAAVTIAVRGTSAPAAPAPPPVGTATVVRTDLTDSVLTQGTLGYAPSPPVINRVGGTYTSLHSPGTVVQPGQVLYRVDNAPVVLMAGALPAWRPFSDGMTDGPDVHQLEANLIALGDAGGLLVTPSAHFGAAAAAAVERWQAALGDPSPTGWVAFGAIVFVPGAIRIDAADVAPGQPASPGDLPYRVTGITRSVSVPLTPNDPSVGTGQSVSIVLPSGATTPGVVTAEGPPAPGASSSSSSSSSSTSSSFSSSSSSSTAASTVLTVTPYDPGATGSADGVAVQVSLAVQSVRHVLAVPVAALLALAGGGYGLEIVEPSGTHHLVSVRTGVFAGGDVQVLGEGLRPGTRLVVAG